MVEYGIEYKRYKLNDTTFLLVPTKLVEGYCYDTVFYDEKRAIKEASTIENITRSKVLVDGIVNDEDLLEFYDEEVEPDFLREYYFLEESEYVLIISTKDNAITKKKLPVSDLVNKDYVEIYEMLNDMSVVTLNEGNLDRLLSLDDLESIKIELQKMKDKIIRYRDEESKNISKIVVSNGTVSRIETNGTLYFNMNSPEYKELSEINGQEASISYCNGDISVSGLYEYMKERVIGHDKELKIIATRLMRNLKTPYGSKTKNILVPGPTGTGKTLTFEVASEYLGVPYTFINTADLVPQGIIGTSLQDAFLSLIDTYGGDEEVVRRAIVVFDEFDKLEVSGLDLKQSVKPIFLKLLEGAPIELQRKNGYGASDNYSFDTALLSKVFLGAFSECFTSEKTLGFESKAEFDKTFSKEKMYKHGYYDRELITRIPIVIPYYELSKEDMRKALFCKSSELFKEVNTLESEFGIKVFGIEDFIEGVLPLLDKKDTSMRDINNIIINAFNDIEYELEDNNGKYKKLVLSSKTATDSTKFELY